MMRVVKIDVTKRFGESDKIITAVVYKPNTALVLYQPQFPLVYVPRLTSVTLYRNIARSTDIHGNGLV